MQILVGADYRGYELKEAVLKFLASETRYEVIDSGTYNRELREDYNGPAVVVAKAVREERDAVGILICESAHGMTIQANRFKGVRAANCDSVESAVLAREHDDANVLCLAAHFVDAGKAREIVKAFLETKFEPVERRMYRINQLDERRDYD